MRSNGYDPLKDLLVPAVLSLEFSSRWWWSGLPPVAGWVFLYTKKEPKDRSKEAKDRSKETQAHLVRGLNFLRINFPCIIPRDGNGRCPFPCLGTLGNED